ncbi:GTP-binding protein [Anaerospora hongkongensis]|uniref:Probable GTP-binding protein EngB n=1 Tax=Anaerospora hongkongensis TaxID=244830 RepID=A0A4R1PW34_9FIRM|nr:GTP-binding protein [Anaerospora hongkongensis]
MMTGTDIAKLHILNAKYLASAVRPDQYPPGEVVEVAFIGRSNVGKSSLINSLCRHRGLALVSGRPGKTQTVNFFSVNAKLEEEQRIEWFLVDLPGYGYAKTAKSNKLQWSKFISQYIMESPRLRLVCQLIDIRHDPMESDKDAYQWLSQGPAPVQLIATKADKLNRSQIKKNTDTIARQLGAQGRVIPYSALKGDGRDELLDTISRILLK